MNHDHKTIREMCDEFGVTPRTLRFYEARELVFPERRGQHRLFTRRDQARLKLILRGKRFGFTLEQIRELLDMYDRDDSELRQVRATLDLARDRLADLEQQRAELDSAINDLRGDIAWAETILRDAGAGADAGTGGPPPPHARG